MRSVTFLRAREAMSGLAPHRLSGFVRLVAAGAIALLSTIGTARFLSRNAESLIGNLVVDDAFYYAVPARHVVEGKPFSFDGEKPANGVQPLWALVNIALAAVVRDDAVLVRLMAGLSALAWFLGGVVLYTALRRCDPWLALLAAGGWALAAFGGRIAFQGMENGIHGLVAALLVWFGARYLRDPTNNAPRKRAFYLWLGLLLALFTLCRVDSGLLALLVGAAVLFGLIHHSGRAALRINIAGALLLALPGIVLVGGYALFSYLYFGIATPISGLVKFHYEREWGPLHGGALGSILWHLRYVWTLATQVPARPIAARAVLLAVVAFGVAGWCWRVVRNRRRPLGQISSWHVYVLVLATFAAARLATYAVALPHFTEYGTWYFAPEIMAVWILIAAGVHSAAEFAARHLSVPRMRSLNVSPGQVACAATVLLILISSVRPVAARPAHDTHTHLFRVGAQWADAHFPSDRKLAAFSAGILGFCARQHPVINLDGLMNDVDYVRDYLWQNRIPAYARDRDIRYLCDYAPLDVWRKGGYWGFATADMKLVRWWRMQGDVAYCIWELPRAGGSDGPRFPDAVADALSQIQYDAEVAGRYEVTTDAELQTALAAGRLAGRRVITSIALWPRLELRHVVVTDEAADVLQLDPAQLDIPKRCNVVLGGEVELLGYDLPVTTVRRGGRMLLTRFWRRRGADTVPAGLSILTRLAPENGGQDAPSGLVLHVTRGCYDTYPVNRWRAGQTVAETYALDIPRSAGRGEYVLSVGLADSQGQSLPADGNAMSTASEFVLGRINVE